jgi:hypothetical protein
LKKKEANEGRREDDDWKREDDDNTFYSIDHLDSPLPIVSELHTPVTGSNKEVTD